MSSTESLAQIGKDQVDPQGQEPAELNLVTGYGALRRKHL